MEETVVHYNVFVLAIARCVTLNTGSNMVYRIELLGVSEVDYIDQSEINIWPYHLCTCTVTLKNDNLHSQLHLAPVRNGSTGMR